MTTPRLPLTVERLMAKSHISESGCFIWDGWKAGKGYGKIGYDGSSSGIYVHRASWTIHNGDIPEGMEIDHICFEKLCWNIEHLRIATSSQNSQYRQGIYKGSRSGFRGVIKRKGCSKYTAYATLDRLRREVHGFARVEDAAEAARRLRLILHSRTSDEDSLGPIPGSELPFNWDPFESNLVKFVKIGARVR